MTRTEQERLVERYIAGAMTSAQEEEFFMRVAVEPNLRQTLKAYRVVDNAIRKHRDAAPVPNTAARSHLLESLNMARADQSGAPGGPTAATGISLRRVTWIVTAVALFAFMCGLLLMNRIAQPDAERAQSTPRPEALQTGLASGSHRFHEDFARAAAVQAATVRILPRDLAEAPPRARLRPQRGAHALDLHERAQTPPKTTVPATSPDTPGSTAPANANGNESPRDPAIVRVTNDTAKIRAKVSLPHR